MLKTKLDLDPDSTSNIAAKLERSEAGRPADEEVPLRARIFTRDEFDQHAHKLAALHKNQLSFKGGRALYSRFDENARVLEGARRTFQELASQKRPLTPGSEWLLDNYHIVEEQVNNIRRYLPRGYYKTLPKLSRGELRGYPRAYILAIEFVLHSDAALDAQLLAQYLRSYQAKGPLSTGELWAIPIMLRLALIENLRRLVSSNLTLIRRNEAASSIIEECLPSEGESGSRALLLFAEKIEEQPVFLGPGAAEIVRLLKPRGSAGNMLLQWFEERLREGGSKPEEIIRQDQHAQAANQITIGNTVTSLRAILHLDWHDWFESVSLVHEKLGRDPSGVYRKSDFATRDSYWHAVEDLAREARRPELEIAECALKLAEANAAGGASSDESERFRHVGYYLADDGRADLERELCLAPGLSGRLRRRLHARPAEIYLGSIGAGSLLLLTWGGLWLTGLNLTPGAIAALVVALALPASEAVIQTLQWLLMRVVHPYVLPRLNLEKGVPDDLRTLVVVNAIIQDEQHIHRLIEFLEVRYIGNEDPNISFALLADLPDSAQERTPGDERLIALAKEQIERLNSRHQRGDRRRFMLLHRKRIWNQSEGKFMGWERKRGKLMELNRVLSGRNSTTYLMDAPTREHLRGFRFVITLDSDSHLPRGSAQRLIAALAHPLNRPLIDQRSNVVVKGYGLIQPRVGTTLQSAVVSLFSRLYSRHAGLDPYTNEVSDLYQDLFREGSYIGKGIYDVAAFERVMSDRVPENTLLSHDLFEGLFARTALASHIELLDDFPSRLNVHARRQHRWVRGDWQLLAWLFSSVPDARRSHYPNPIGPLGRWKLFDNLRRSLLAPALLMGLLLGWILLPGAYPLYWSMALLAPLLLPACFALIDGTRAFTTKVDPVYYLRRLLDEALACAGEAVLSLCLLPYNAYLMTHAICVAIYRMLYSRRGLLEWQTAHASEKALGNELSDYMRSMAPGLAISAAGLACVVAFSPWALLYSAPIFVAWFASPFVAFVLSQPVRTESRPLRSDQESYLREIALSTWRYFDDLIDASQNYLIPDNLQMRPQRVLAERTSPTNIALSIMAVISAYDLGFIPLPAVVRKVSPLFDTLGRLERYQGHYLNWYNTRTLQPLAPRYVSTVDSGNLVGFLIAARTFFHGYAQQALLGASNWRFIERRLGEAMLGCRANGDLRELLSGAIGSFERTPDNARETGQALRRLAALCAEIDLRKSALSGEMALCLDRLRVDLLPFSDLTASLEGVEITERLAEFLRTEQGVPESLGPLHAELEQLLSGPCAPGVLERMYSLAMHALKELFLLPEEGRAPSLESFMAGAITMESSLRRSSLGLTHLSSSVRRISESADAIVQQTDFRFLYDQDKKLFSIGYNLDTARRDQSYYDFLASEARLASLVAIAKSDVPQEHWFMLSRSITDAPGGKVLVSWSGTMFEYLMPLLVTKRFEGTLLSEAYASAVKTQQIYCRGKNVPWGISESGFSRQNFESTYQYRAFGVPALGLKRGLADDLVASPYSTFLALPLDPQRALDNLYSFDKLGMRGEYGFYEAIDFTPERLSRDESHHVVASFFAHHQGMSLVSICNFLCDGVMQKRFHEDPLIKATELLLHERFPASVESRLSHAEEALREPVESDEDERPGMCEILHTPFTRYPRTRLLSNGRLSVMLSNSGSGHTFFERKTSLTRWRDDAISDCSGLFIYLRDTKSGQIWSGGYQPTRSEPDSYDVFFGPDKIEIKRSDFGIQTHTEITVSQDEDVELRRVTLRNLTGQRRRIEVTSYGEVVLGSRAGDLAHPAFSKLFVVSDYYPDLQALIYKRRPRSPGDEELYLLHSLTLPICWEHTQYETSRARFLGRGNSLSNPAALKGSDQLSGALGSVLDPIFSLRTGIEVNPGESQVLTFVTGIGRSLQEVIRISQHYQQYHSVQRAFEMAWSQSGIEIRQGELSLQQIHLFERLAAGILYDLPHWRCKPELIEQNRLPHTALWRFGISGDEPIVLLRLTDPNQMPLLRELLDAHGYLGRKGLTFELAVFNEYPGGYMQAFQQAIEEAVRGSSSGALFEKKGGVYLRSSQQISSDELGLLAATARMVLNGSDGGLKRQLRAPEGAPEMFQRGSRHQLLDEIGMEQENEARGEAWNGFGAFSDQGRAYTIETSRETHTPLPWSNVLANPGFGCLVTESGGGYTWCGNSRENRLTEWSNDPIQDPRGEVLYLRDADSGYYWSATPFPCGHGARYRTKHAFGWSQFTSRQNSVASSLTVLCSPRDPVKHYHLVLANQHYTEKTVELYFYVEWVLGVDRSAHARHVVTRFDDVNQVLTATSWYSPEFAGRCAFIGSSEELSGHTGSRIEFIGRFGDLAAPLFLERSSHVSRPFMSEEGSRTSPGRKTGARLDPCGLLKVSLNLQPGEEQQVSFFIGQAADTAAAAEIIQRARRPLAGPQEQKAVESFWSERLERIVVRTPERSFDIMLNGWLAYQTLACRIWGRSGFFQSGGAFGFRDQLQDSLGLIYLDPQVTREQILLNAHHQFLEGDVQHWWHPPSGRGVRTRISDNLLWLPYALDRYLEITGDEAILNEETPFLEGPLLEPHEHDRYFVPAVSKERGNLYEHCARALEYSLERIGEHGLALMGSGDWNDGMNHVGPHGKGESVWLSWFLADVLGKMSGIASRIGRIEDSKRFEERRDKLRESIERSAWDGEWYRRAYFDDGTPLGSKQNDECQIDSLAQTWSVISGAGDPRRSGIAMRHVHERLVREDHGVIQLLDPPFDAGTLQPGYIKGYPAGIRENGGQYTHAAAWVVMATALQGDGDGAIKLFQLLNPINHTSDQRKVQRYQTEPYVMCGDVYSVPPLAGRGGWSWYTGSAGWLYRVGIENILGLQLRPDHFWLSPCIPASWPEYSIQLDLDGTRYSITVKNPDGVCRGDLQVAVDGESIPDGKISRSGRKQGEVTVVVTMLLPGETRTADRPSERTGLTDPP